MQNEAIRAWADAHTEEMLRDIAGLVAIPSVSQPGDGPHPYGEGCARVLEKALELGASQGLETRNHEYRCGTARLAGKRGGELGVFTHLDIVPEGAGWSGDPFRMERRGDWLVGRGVADDKGPAVASLYAVRCLRDLGVTLDHAVLLWFGCSEELGMQDLMWYRDHFPQPAFSFTPDTAFPVCNGEKGILELNSSFPLPGGILMDFQAGTASNIVPDEAFAVLRCALHEAQAALSGGDCHLEEQGETVRITAKGVGGHAARPEGTRNAMAVLAATLADSGLLSGEEQRCMAGLTRLFGDAYGAGIGAPLSDEVSGRLTHNGGVTRLRDGVLHQNINIRYPITADREAMLADIRAALEEAGFSLDSTDDDPPCHTPADSPAVKALAGISNEVMGVELPPYIMGGGTYARKLKKAVGFGPRDPRQEVPYGGAHQPDECASVSGLVRAVEIYVKALIALDTLVE